MLIYWSYHRGTYVAEVPELPGCAAEGATQRDALEAVQLEVARWLASAAVEGRDIPDPQGDVEPLGKQKQGRGGRRQERIEKRRRNRERVRQERCVNGRER